MGPRRGGNTSQSSHVHPQRVFEAASGVVPQQPAMSQSWHPGGAAPQRPMQRRPPPQPISSVAPRPPAPPPAAAAVPPPPTSAREARRHWRDHGEAASQVLEDRRTLLSAAARSAGGVGAVYAGHGQPTSTVRTSALSGGPAFGVRVISSEDRLDAVNNTYTAYVISVEGNNGRYTVEHRYSEFARLASHLAAAEVKLRSSFPPRSLAGRLGDWTPSASVAPAKQEELVTTRRVKLDIWLVELAEVLARGELGSTPSLRDEVVEFFYEESESAV